MLSTGPSAIFLDPIHLNIPPDPAESDQESSARAQGAQDFSLSYIPITAGFSTLGGLRIILVDDQLADEGELTPSETQGGGLFGAGVSEVRRPTDVQVLREWDVIGEIWVRT